MSLSGYLLALIRTLPNLEAEKQEWMMDRIELLIARAEADELPINEAMAESALAISEEQ